MYTMAFPWRSTRSVETIITLSTREYIDGRISTSCYKRPNSMHEDLKFQQSIEMADYQPFVTSLTAELGPEFARSMRNWCGLEPRPYPLADWEIFIARQSNQPVGICSHYRQPDDSQRRYWIGWIGVLKDERRRGIGSAMLRFIEERLWYAYEAPEVWVYTDTVSAVSFYQANGYQPAGTFGEIHLPQAAAREDSTVLRKVLG